MANKKTKQNLIPLKEGQTIYTGTPISELVRSSYKNFVYNPKTDEAEIIDGGVTISLNDKDALRYYDGDTVSLLLYTLTLNHETGNTTVYINLKEYASKSGYDVYNEDEKTAKAQLDLFRKRFNKALRKLANISVKWITTKGKARGDYERQILITGDGLKNGIQHIDINKKIIEPLRENDFISQIPQTALLMIAGADDKTTTKNANKVLYKLSQHYNLNRNKERGSNNILSVQSVLSYTTLPTIEGLESKNNRNFERLIKEPLEAILDYLQDTTHDIALWYYCKAKKEPYTDNELQSISTKELLQTGYIYFELATIDKPTLADYSG